MLEEAGQREARLRKTTEEARRGREEDDLLPGRHGELGEETEDDTGRGRKGGGGGGNYLIFQTAPSSSADGNQQMKSKEAERLANKGLQVPGSVR